MCLGWMDYCLFVGSFSFAHLSTPLSRFFSSPVLCNCGLGESAGRTLNWKLVKPLPPPEFFSSCCWSLALFWEGSLDIKLIIKPVRLCPTSQPCFHPHRSGEFQHSHGAVVHPATWQDQISKLFYFSPTLEPAPMSTLYSLHPFFAFFIW